MPLSKARRKELDDVAIKDVAFRTHALLVVAKGTSAAPSLEKVEEAIREGIGIWTMAPAAERDQYQFLMTTIGVWIYFNESPMGPGEATFQTIVPASGEHYLWTGRKSPKGPMHVIFRGAMPHAVPDALAAQGTTNIDEVDCKVCLDYLIDYVSTKMKD